MKSYNLKRDENEDWIEHHLIALGKLACILSCTKGIDLKNPYGTEQEWKDKNVQSLERWPRIIYKMTQMMEYVKDIDNPSSSYRTNIYGEVDLDNGASLWE